MDGAAAAGTGVRARRVGAGCGERTRGGERCIGERRAIGLGECGGRIAVALIGMEDVSMWVEGGA
jgi:hypothetical protein